MTVVVTILTGIPGVGKTKRIDKLLRSNPKKRKIYLTLSHKQLKERSDFLSGVVVTHWHGMKRICPLKTEEPIATMLEIGAPIRWICKLCQSLKSISPNDCPHKAQFQNPTNVVIAPASYLFTGHVEKYDPQLVIVDDVMLYGHDLLPLSSMRTYVKTLHWVDISYYETMEELFEEQGNDLQREISGVIEPRLKLVIQNLLEEGSDLSKESARILLRIDPMELLDWKRLVKAYGWQEEFTIPHLSKVFELALEKYREVIVVGALANKPFLEMLVRYFQKEYGKPIILNFQRIELEQPVAKSTVYRVRSRKYPDAWYPTTTSIVRGGVQRKLIKQRIETILLRQVDEPSDISKLSVGIVKPKKVDMNDFLTPFIQRYAKVSSLDFGSLRGSNTLEDCDILFVIGTYAVNIEGLQKAFKRFYHREPLSTEAVKLFDGGYKYSDRDLENYRRMVEDNEMYQAIHRVRPALKEKKVYVFGLIPEEIRTEFQVEDVTFERNHEGELWLVGWSNFEKFIEEKIGETGIYHADLVKMMSEKFGFSREATRNKIRKFVNDNSNTYEVTEKTAVGDRKFKFVQRRR